MTCSFLIQLVFYQKSTLQFIGVEVKHETRLKNWTPYCQTAWKWQFGTEVCGIVWYVFSAVHIMLLPSQKPSSLYLYSLLCHFLVVHRLLRRILDPPLLLIFCQHQTIQRICKTAKFIPCHILWSLDIPLILLSASPPSYVKHDSNIPLSTPL